MNGSQAAALIEQAIPNATPHEKALVYAIGKLESSWGRGWSGSGVGSHNWGAITGTYRGHAFQYQDSRPNPQGGAAIVYTTNFRKYPSDLEGIVDLYNLLKSRYSRAVDAANAGDWWGVSEPLYGYYLGTHPNRAVNVERHQKSFTSSLPEPYRTDALAGKVVAASTSAPQHSRSDSGSSSEPSNLPVLRAGNLGNGVKLLQRCLNCKVDGVFGPKTEAAVVKHQSNQGLREDGIVGPKTWNTLP